MKCWDAEAVNRPTAYELYQILKKWYIEWNNDNYNNCNSCNDDSKIDKNSEIYIQIEKCEKIRKIKSTNSSNENKSSNIQTHPQAIYTSRLFNFKNLQTQ